MTYHTREPGGGGREACLPSEGRFREDEHGGKDTRGNWGKLGSRGLTYSCDEQKVNIFTCAVCKGGEEYGEVERDLVKDVDEY